MDIVSHIKRRFSTTSTSHYNFGKDNTTGIFECGFIRKPQSSSNDYNVLFRYYGGLILIDGSGTYIDDSGLELPLYPGCFIQRIPGKCHSTIVNSDGNWIEGFVCFGDSLYHSYEQLGIFNSATPVLHTGLNPAFLQSFISLYDTAQNANVHQLPALINKAIGIVIQAHELDKLNNAITNNDIIYKACRIIENSCHINITAMDIAHQLNVSYEKFRKLFKLETGVSPNFFIIQRKINIAKAMLLVPKKSIKEISIELGYPDQFSFSKQFKKMTGVSPVIFRQSYS